MKPESAATNRSEVPVFFRAGGESLFGILTEPEIDARGTAVIVLRGGGQGPSAGRDQTSARLCWRLAQEGYHALRFDYRGVGESTGTVERFRLDQPFTEDLESAINYLSDRGLQRVILVGGCFGGRTALACAPSIPGLESIVFLTLPVRDKEKDEIGTRPLVPDRTFWGYALRIVRPHVIRGLFRRDQRRTYARVATAAWRRRSSQHHPRSAVQNPHWLSPELTDALDAVVRRRIPILIVAGTEDPGHKDFEDAMAGHLGEITGEAGAKIDIELLRGRVDADATLHEPVIDIVASWILARGGS